jgi:hypothetical protein
VAVAIPWIAAATAVWSASDQQKNSLAANDRIKNQAKRQDELIEEGKKKKSLADKTAADKIIASRSLNTKDKPTVEATDTSTLVTSPLGSSPTPYGGNKRQLGV